MRAGAPAGPAPCWGGVGRLLRAPATGVRGSPSQWAPVGWRSPHGKPMSSGSRPSLPVRSAMPDVAPRRAMSPEAGGATRGPWSAFPCTALGVCAWPRPGARPGGSVCWQDRACPCGSHGSGVSEALARGGRAAGSCPRGGEAGTRTEEAEASRAPQLPKQRGHQREPHPTPLGPSALASLPASPRSSEKGPARGRHAELG